MMSSDDLGLEVVKILGIDPTDVVRVDIVIRVGQPINIKVERNIVLARFTTPIDGLARSATILARENYTLEKK